MHLRLGTRRSLLAWAQSSWVARRLEELNPGLQVQLVGIETRGDKILDVSLQSVQGKEFFVAELDEALRSGAVDLTVHSMKDLSLDRPREFVCAAIPRRENPRDVVLFGPGVLEKIRQGQTLRIGTSSPRRLENIPPFLAQALPRLASDSAPKVELIEIRGNVNTRLSRVHEPHGSAKHLDGVVLAFAGLIRLWADEAGRVELQKLLRRVRWMVLPIKECPAAPAQGALAVECLEEHTEVREALRKLHDPEAEKNVARERQLLADWGGGCHQKFGATALRIDGLGQVMFVRGVKPDSTFVEETRWSPPACTGIRSKRWDGSQWREKNYSKEESLSQPESLAESFGGKAVFVAHSRAWPSSWSVRSGETRVWTSGTSSWKRLAKEGVWVEGCAEGLGFAELETTLREKVLQLPEIQDWTVLTHEGAVDGWKSAKIMATYRVKTDWGPEARDAMQKATHIYWSSGSQFDELGSLAQSQAHHACGPGKTAARLREAGLNPDVFPSVEEWRKWLENIR